MNKYFISLSIISACLLCSCDYRINQQNEKILTAVADLVYDEVNSAYSLLNTLDVKELNEPHYHRYVTLKVHVKDKLYLNATEDTVVFQAMNYFLKNNNNEYKLISCFASARVQEEQNNQEKAMEYYLEAIKWLDETRNFLLNGDIYYNLARLLYLMNQYEHSLFYAENARKYYDLANCRYEKKIYINELFAFNYLCLSNVDSSLLFFKSAENIAIRNKDIFNEQRIVQSMAVAYRDANEFKIAKEKCWHALSLVSPSDSLNIGKLQLTLGAAFLGEGKIDSATISLYKADRLLENSNSLVDLIELYRLLSEVEVINKNYEQASTYQTLYNRNSITRNDYEQGILTALKKNADNTFHVLQAERDKLANKQSNLYIALIILSLIIISGALFYRGKMNIRKLKGIFHTFKEKSENEKAQMLAKAEEEKAQVIAKAAQEKAQMKAEFEETVTELKNDFSLEQLLIVFQINNAAELDEILTARDMQTNYRKAQVQVKLLIESMTWEAVFTGLKNAHNGLADNLLIDFPELSEKEYRIFLLSCSGFSVMGIAKILRYSISYIQGFQTDIRKKTGIASSGSFLDFVYKKYGLTINR